MPKQRHLIVGCATLGLVAGLALLTNTDRTFLLAWGALIYGVLTVGFGVAEHIIEPDDNDASLANRPYIERLRRRNELVFQAMYLIAIVDGGESGERSSTVQKMLWSISNGRVELSNARLNQLRQEIDNDRRALAPTLERERHALPPGTSELIMKASIFVATAEGEISPDAKAELNRLADALQLPSLDVLETP